MRTISILKYSFTLIGVVLLAVAFYLFTNTQAFLQTALTVNGTVIELQRSRSTDSITYRPVVEFTTKSGSTVEFTSSSGSNPPSYSRGEIVEVLYHEASPEKAKINGFFSLWGASTIVGGLGLIFFLIGFSMLFAKSLKNKRIKYLRNNGTRISAKIQSVDINRSYKVNGRSPYKIHSQWENPRTSEIHIFSSENIWFDPTEYIDSDEITVLIDRDKPKNYLVDISFLPNLAD